MFVKRIMVHYAIPIMFKYFSPYITFIRKLIKNKYSLLFKYYNSF